MPRVTDDHLAARRRQILDGARRCFAEYGYDKATVRRLEQTIGLSRGAIFHHFRDKDTLFFELAREDAERMADVASREGSDPGDARHAGRARAVRLAGDPAGDRAQAAQRSGVQPGLVGALGRAVGGDHRPAAQAEAGRAAARRRAQRGAADLSGPGARRSGGATGLRRRPRKAQCRTGPRRGLGATAATSSAGSATARLRWFGPPRLRIVVPDSRSMLWIEPYERPVVATRVRMLAPPS